MVVFTAAASSVCRIVASRAARSAALQFPPEPPLDEDVTAELDPGDILEESWAPELAPVEAELPELTVDDASVLELAGAWDAEFAEEAAGADVPGACDAELAEATSDDDDTADPDDDEEVSLSPDATQP